MAKAKKIKEEIIVKENLETKEKKKPGRKKSEQVEKIEEIIEVKEKSSSIITTTDTTQNVDVVSEELNIIDSKEPETLTESKEEEVQTMKTVYFTNSPVEKGLSAMALQWKKYLEYSKITPESFLIRYPNHKFKSFVEEIVAFNNSSKENNI